MMHGRLYLLGLSCLWIAVESIGADSSHWCFEPLAKVTPPPEAEDPWARTPIDGFILAKLRKKGLSPQPEADRHTLIRRLTFNLTGLPPTPQEINQFLQGIANRRKKH